MTPRVIIDICRALDISPRDLAPTDEDLTMDPSSGTGGFLISVLGTFGELSPEDQEKLLSYGEYLLHSGGSDKNKKPHKG